MNWCWHVVEFSRAYFGRFNDSIFYVFIYFFFGRFSSIRAIIHALRPSILFFFLRLTRQSNQRQQHFAIYYLMLMVNDDDDYVKFSLTRFVHEINKFYNTCRHRICGGELNIFQNFLFLTFFAFISHFVYCYQSPIEFYCVCSCRLMFLMQFNNNNNGWKFLL